MWIGIILIMISTIFLILVFNIKKEDFKNIFAWASTICAIVGGLYLGSWSEEKNTAIKCHEGNNPYVQIIQYKYEGNNLIDQNTIYIKKENYEEINSN